MEVYRVWRVSFTLSFEGGFLHLNLGKQSCVNRQLVLEIGEIGTQEAIDRGVGSEVVEGESLNNENCYNFSFKAKAS